MKLSACFYLFLVAVAVIEAGPAARAAEDSLEESKAAEEGNLKIEEIGEEKDRSKKAAICLQLEPQESQFSAMTVPQQVPLNLIQPQPSFVLPQQMSQQMIVPQPAVQPVHTLQIVQPAPAQPCTSSINVIQSVPETNAAVQKVDSPRPRPTPSSEVETITERPMRFEKPLPPPRESYAVLPVMPYQYQEPVVAMSDACTDPLHGLQCSCRQVDPMAMMSMVPYPSAYARSSMPVMRPMVLNRARSQPTQPRTKTYINVNVPPGYYGNQRPPPQMHQTVNQEMYLNGVDLGPYGTRGISMNVPRLYRSSEQSAHRVPTNSLSAQDSLTDESLVEADDLVAGNKSPREIDASQLSPEQMKREESQATDSKRDTRSDERVSTIRKKQ